LHALNVLGEMIKLHIEVRHRRDHFSLLLLGSLHE